MEVSKWKGLGDGRHSLPGLQTDGRAWWLLGLKMCVAMVMAMPKTSHLESSCYLSEVAAAIWMAIGVAENACFVLS